MKFHDFSKSSYNCKIVYIVKDYWSGNCKGGLEYDGCLIRAALKKSPIGYDERAECIQGAKVQCIC